MELDLLRSQKEQMIMYLHDQGYSERYIDSHRNISEMISSHLDEIPGGTFDDAMTWACRLPYSSGYLGNIKSIIRNLKYYHTKGYLPGNGEIQAALKEIVPSCGQLDFTILQSRMDELLGYMEYSGYCKDYQRIIRDVGNRIIFQSRTIPWNSYEEIWEWYQSQHYKKYYLQNIQTALGLLQAFHLRNEFPRNVCNSNALCKPRAAYSKLNDEYRSLVDFSEDQRIRRSLSRSSIIGNRSAASNFLLYMQNLGLSALKMIDSSAVYSYYNSSAVRSNGRGLTPKIKSFLQDCISYDGECNRIIMLLPLAPTGRENIQYITDEESTSFVDALTDMRNGLSYRARAIGTLLYYTGMRRSDIANLKLDSIDLRRQIISIVQQKTQEPLVLPLAPVVGNAIYDYCALERPDSASDHLFVCSHAPHNGIDKNTIGYLINQVLDAADIRQNEGDRRGTLIFRHRVATKLLENNVAPAVISQTMGHRSPESLNPYLYTDKAHLKECALSIAMFPIGMEVFSRVCK